MISKLLALLLFCLPAFGINSPAISTAQLQMAPGPDVQSTFDRLQGIPAFRKYHIGQLMRESHNTLICVYDFPTQGGAIGLIGLLSSDLRTPCALPGKTVIRNGFVDVTTLIQGSSALTMSLSSGQTLGDLKVTLVSPSFAATGQYLISPVFATLSTYIKLTTANSVVNGVNLNAYQPYLQIGGAAITAGHFRVFIDYSISE